MSKHTDMLCTVASTKAHFSPRVTHSNKRGTLVKKLESTLYLGQQQIKSYIQVWNVCAGRYMTDGCVPHHIAEFALYIETPFQPLEENYSSSCAKFL